MPQTLNVGAFVFGAILVHVALLGGRFKLFGAEVSDTVGLPGRTLAGLIGAVLIGLGFFYQGPFSPVATPATPVTLPAPAPARAPEVGPPSASEPPARAATAPVLPS